jgi:hypothetical protein
MISESGIRIIARAVIALHDYGMTEDAALLSKKDADELRAFAAKAKPKVTVEEHRQEREDGDK